MQITRPNGSVTILAAGCKLVGWRCALIECTSQELSYKFGNAQEGKERVKQYLQHLQGALSKDGQLIVDGEVHYVNT